MAEEAPTLASTQCPYIKRGGNICGRAKLATHPFCRRCNQIIKTKAPTPRYRTPNALEPPMKAKMCSNPGVVNAPELAALPTNSMITNPEIYAELSTIKTTLAAIQTTLINLAEDNEKIKESIEDLNNKIDSETYHRKRGLAICYHHLGIQMPHRMRHESPPSFIVNPIGSIPDSPNHITIPAPKSPKPTLGKRQQKSKKKH